MDNSRPTNPRRMPGPRAPKMPTERCAPRHHGPLGNGLCRGQDGDQPAIAQDQGQVRRRIAVRTLKDFFARLDFADQRLRRCADRGSGAAHRQAFRQKAGYSAAGTPGEVPSLTTI